MPAPQEVRAGPRPAERPLLRRVRAAAPRRGGRLLGRVQPAGAEDHLPGRDGRQGLRHHRWVPPPASPGPLWGCQGEPPVTPCVSPQSGPAASAWGSAPTPTASPTTSPSGRGAPARAGGRGQCWWWDGDQWQQGATPGPGCCWGGGVGGLGGLGAVGPPPGAPPDAAFLPAGAPPRAAPAPPPTCRTSSPACSRGPQDRCPGASRRPPRPQPPRGPRLQPGPRRGPRGEPPRATPSTRGGRRCGAPSSAERPAGAGGALPGRGRPCSVGHYKGSLK